MNECFSSGVVSFSFFLRQVFIFLRWVVVLGERVRVFGFDVKKYHTKLAEKAKREAEKNRMREQFESGVM